MLSRIGNEQHNPGAPLQWDRSKSGDELDALTRHLMEAGTIDTDGVRHSAKVAWRALANLQKEIEKIENENPQKIAPGNWTEVEAKEIRDGARHITAEAIEGNPAYYNIKDLTGRIVASVAAPNERVALEIYRTGL
jgi:hypothetical protein